MKIIDRYVIRQLLPPILLGLLVFTFVLIIPQIKEHAESFIAKGVSPGVVLTAMLLLVPQALALTIPMSFLLGLLIAFSRLSADREFVAMQACGMSLARLLRPVGLISRAVRRRHLLRLGDRRARQQPALPRDRVQRRGPARRVQGALARLLRRLPQPGSVRARRARRPAAAGTACSSPTRATRRRRRSTWRGTAGWRSIRTRRSDRAGARIGHAPHREHQRRRTRCSSSIALVCRSIPRTVFPTRRPSAGTTR